MMFPGEQEAIDQVVALGEKYGYGNLIGRLKDAWSKKQQTEYGFTAQQADLGAGHICVWCKTDTRTGKVVDGRTTPPLRFGGKGPFSHKWADRNWRADALALLAWSFILCVVALSVTAFALVIYWTWENRNVDNAPSPAPAATHYRAGQKGGHK